MLDFFNVNSVKSQNVCFKIYISVPSNRVIIYRQSQLENRCGIRCTDLSRYVDELGTCCSAITNCFTPDVGLSQQTALPNYWRFNTIKWPTSRHIPPPLYSPYGGKAVYINTFCQLIANTSCIAVRPDSSKSTGLIFFHLSQPTFFLWK